MLHLKLHSMPPSLNDITPSPSRAPTRATPPAQHVAPTRIQPSRPMVRDITAPVKQPVRVAPPQRKTSGGATAQAMLERFQMAQATYRRNHEQRQEERKTLSKDIRKTFFLIIISAVAIAGIADLLSLADLGWIVSWVIPAITWFLARRIRTIEKGSESIAKATQRAERQLTILQQRLRPVFGSRVGGSRIGIAFAQARSYMVTYIRDTIIAQLLELIPVVDMLPLYLGQVIKMVVEQNIAYQKALKLMPVYDQLITDIDRLERMELAHLGTLANAALATTIRQIAAQRKAQQLISAPEVPSLQALSYSFAT